MTLHALGYDRRTWIPVWFTAQKSSLVGGFGELGRDVPVRISPAGPEAEQLLKTLKQLGYREAFVGRVE